jgi:hypothetical protein
MAFGQWPSRKPDQEVMPRTRGSRNNGTVFGAKELEPGWSLMQESMGGSRPGGSGLHPLQRENSRLKQQVRKLELELGKLQPPKDIGSHEDAELWLAWAASVGHTDGCQCRRCPVARRFLGNGARAGATCAS